jgi:hypothetical protein
MYFTYNIISKEGHFETFISNLSRIEKVSATNITYNAFIANLEVAVKNLSNAFVKNITYFGPQISNYSYSKILIKMTPTNDTDDEQFEKTIPLQLNGISHYFTTPNYFTNPKDIENNTITKFAGGGGKKKTLRRKVIKQSFHPNHAAKKTNKKHKRRQDDSRRLTESDANVAEKTNEGVRSRRLTDANADVSTANVSTANVSTANANVSASTGTKETNQGVRQLKSVSRGVSRGTKTRRRKGHETTVERTVGGKKTRRSLRP